MLRWLLHALAERASRSFEIVRRCLSGCVSPWCVDVGVRSSLSFLVSCASCVVVVFVGGFYVSRASESSFRNDGLRWSLTISCRRLGLSSSWLVVVGVCVHARASWLVRPNDVARVSDDPLLPTEISHAWPFPSRSSFKLSNETDMRSMSWRRGSIPPPRMGALEDLFPRHGPFLSHRQRDRETKRQGETPVGWDRRGRERRCGPHGGRRSFPHPEPCPPPMPKQMEDVATPPSTWGQERDPAIQSIRSPRPTRMDTNTPTTATPPQWNTTRHDPNRRRTSSSRRDTTDRRQDTVHACVSSQSNTLRWTGAMHGNVERTTKNSTTIETWKRSDATHVAIQPLPIP